MAGEILKQTLFWSTGPDRVIQDLSGAGDQTEARAITAAESHDGSDATYESVTANDDGADNVNADASVDITKALGAAGVAGTIAFIRVKVRTRIALVAGSGGSSGTWQPMIAGLVRGAVASAGPAVFADDSQDFTTDPADGQPWTNAKINAKTFGAQLRETSFDSGFNTHLEIRLAEFSVEVWVVGGQFPTVPDVAATPSGSASVFKNLALGGVVGPQTLTGGSAAVLSGGIPCKGARAVRVRCTATNGVAPSAMSFNVGNSPLRSELWLTGSGVGLTTRGNPAVRCDQSGGNTMLLVSPDRRGLLSWDYVQFSVTPNGTGGQDVTGFTVDAEVLYDDVSGDAQAFGQSGATVSSA